MARKKLSSEQIKAVADSLLPGFIPEDPAENNLIFYFTIEGINIQASYMRTSAGPKSSWVLQDVREVEE